MAWEWGGGAGGQTATESADACGRRLTQSVDHADPAHVQLQEGVVHGLPPLVVHEEVVHHGAQLGGQAGQEVDHAQPRDADLGPGNVERQQHQEAKQRDTWRRERRRAGVIMGWTQLWPPGDTG